jgi:two-component system chemotaxis response regulator CheB
MRPTPVRLGRLHGAFRATAHPAVLRSAMASPPDHHDPAAPPPPWIVAIGASGRAGLHDARALLAALPPTLDAAVLVVVHQSFDRLSHLREYLAHATDMPVVVAAEGERFEPGRCYIGEPAAHLTLAARGFGGLVADPGAAHRNRTIDLLFRSLAARGGDRVVGVVLSGALDDGARGLAAIHAAGGRTMVVTRDSPHRPGMPESAIAHDDPIDCIGSPRRIAEAIHRLVGAGHGQPGDHAQRSSEP